jgi:competence protein ComFC
MGMQKPAALIETWNGFLELLYPPKCGVCGRMGEHPLCATCRAGFEDLEPPVCDRCGLEVSPKGPALCKKCEGGEVHYFTKARAAGRYCGPLRQAILNLKYGEKPQLARPLGLYLAAYLQTSPFSSAKIDLVVPVPLHGSRLRQRGFNQSGLLAQEVGKTIGLPVHEAVLRRTRRTKPQAELSASDRAANIRDAFSVADALTVQGRTVLLIDDILTTCHTVDEAARVLVNAGARVVCVAAVARDV